MPDPESPNMTRSRGLITTTELERIQNPEDVDDQLRYQAISRVRRRIAEELPKEMDILEEEHPELLAELRDVVCDENSPNDG